MCNISDFVISDGVLKKYTGTDSHVTIPDGVERIECSFRRNENLKTVTIPDTVCYISQDAFSECKKLKEVIFPQGLKYIGAFAFSDCKSLQKIVFPAGLEHIGKQAFHNCRKLKAIVLPQGLKYIGEGAFGECVCLESVRIEATECTIGPNVFYKCKSLVDENGYIIINGMLFWYCGEETELVIPEHVKTVERGAFNGKGNAITKIEIPESVQTIEAGALAGVKALADESGFIIDRGVLHGYLGKSAHVKIPDGVETIGPCAFYFSNIRSVTFPESVVRIGESAFDKCHHLKEISLPDHLSELGENAFYLCSTLEKVRLPSSLRVIPKYCFAATALKSVTIPEGVAEIGRAAFGIRSLKTVYFLSPLTTIGEFAFFEASATIHGPAGSTAERFAKKNDLPFVRTGGFDISNPRIKAAFEAFVNHVNEMEDTLYRLKYEWEPYGSDNNYMYVPVDGSYLPEEADEFFDLVEAYLTENGVGFDSGSNLSAAQIAKECREKFREIVENSAAGKRVYPVVIPIRVCIAVGLACLFFLADKVNLEVTLNRDKWESRGDYCSAEKAVYSITNGKAQVVTKKYKPYSF